MADIDNSEDIIDSRDIIARIEELSDRDDPRPRHALGARATSAAVPTSCAATSATLRLFSHSA